MSRLILDLTIFLFSRSISNHAGNKMLIVLGQFPIPICLIPLALIERYVLCLTATE